METRELLEEIRDRSIDAMNSMEAGTTGGSNGGDGSPKSPGSASGAALADLTWHTHTHCRTKVIGSKTCLIQ